MFPHHIADNIVGRSPNDRAVSFQPFDDPSFIHRASYGIEVAAHYCH